MLLSEMLSALSEIQDHTRLGHLIKDGSTFVPENDAEHLANKLWQEFIHNFFENKFSAYITAETIKRILDDKDELYNPDKLERIASFIRNKLRPAQIITDEWLVYFTRRFK